MEFNRGVRETKTSGSRLHGALHPCPHNLFNMIKPYPLPPLPPTTLPQSTLYCVNAKFISYRSCTRFRGVPAKLYKLSILHKQG